MILLVENHRIFAEIVVNEFMSDYEVMRVSTIKEASVKLLHEKFDRVLVDYDLDDGKGIDLEKK